MLEIRQENKNDYEEVYNVVKLAFETAEHSDGNEYGIKAPFEVPDENFMAIKLNDTDIEINGTVQYAKEFGI